VFIVRGEHIGDGGVQYCQAEVPLPSPNSHGYWVWR